MSKNTKKTNETLDEKNQETKVDLDETNTEDNLSLDENNDENSTEENSKENESIKTEADGISEEDYNSLVDTLQKTQDELNKFKHFNRKLENEKKGLLIEMSKAKLIKEFNLTEEASVLLTGKSEEQLREKAETLKSLLGDTSNESKNNSNYLQGLSEENEDDDASKENAILVRNILREKYKNN